MSKPRTPALLLATPHTAPAPGHAIANLCRGLKARNLTVRVNIQAAAHELRESVGWQHDLPNTASNYAG